MLKVSRKSIVILSEALALCRIDSAKNLCVHPSPLLRLQGKFLYFVAFRTPHAVNEKLEASLNDFPHNLIVRCPAIFSPELR